MIPLHEIAIRLPPKAPLGETLRALIERVGPPQEFFVWGATSTVDTADRVRKFLPELVRCCHEHGYVAFLRDPWYINVSNGKGGFNEETLPISEGTAPDPAHLITLAEGVPRRFPADEAMFVWKEAPWLGSRADIGANPKPAEAGRPMGYYDTPEPMLALYRDFGGRSVLRGWVRADVPPGAKRPPALPGAVTTLLSPLGKVSDLGLMPRFDADEVAALRAAGRQASERLRVLETQLPPMPHVLPDPGEPRDLNPLAHDHRSDGDRVLGPLGYKALPGAGITGQIVWSRESKLGNRLEVHVDYGTRAHRVSARLDVVGLGWREWISLNFSEFLVRGSYSIQDEAAYARVMDNVGVLVAHLEKNAVPEVERLLPPTPRWWKLPAKAVRTP